MGQRLNVEIHYEGEIMANAYYHWSGYTRSALEVTKEIINAYQPYQENIKMPKEVIAIRLLESTGARLTPEELRVANDRFKDDAPFEGDANRNDGLISITKEGIENTRGWEEGRVILNLDDETVDFYVCNYYFKEQYLDVISWDLNHDSDRLTDEMLEIKFKEIPLYDVDLEEFHFSEIEERMKFVDDLVRQGHYQYRLPDENVISFYE